MISKIYGYTSTPQYNKNTNKNKTQLSFGTMKAQIHNMLNIVPPDQELWRLKDLLTEIKIAGEHKIIRQEADGSIICDITNNNSKLRVTLDPNYRETTQKIQNPYTLFPNNERPIDDYFKKEKNYKEEKSLFELEVIDPPSTPQILIEKQGRTGNERASIINDYFDRDGFVVKKENEKLTHISSMPREGLGQKIAEDLQTAFSRIYEELRQIYRVTSEDRHIIHNDPPKKEDVGTATTIHKASQDAAKPPEKPVINVFVQNVTAMLQSGIKKIPDQTLGKTIFASVKNPNDRIVIIEGDTPVILHCLVTKGSNGTQSSIIASVKRTPDNAESYDKVKKFIEAKAAEQESSSNAPKSTAATTNFVAAADKKQIPIFIRDNTQHRSIKIYLHGGPKDRKAGYAIVETDGLKLPETIKEEDPKYMELIISLIKTCEWDKKYAKENGPKLTELCKQLGPDTQAQIKPLIFAEG